MPGASPNFRYLLCIHAVICLLLSSKSFQSLDILMQNPLRIVASNFSQFEWPPAHSLSNAGLHHLLKDRLGLVPQEVPEWKVRLFGFVEPVTSCLELVSKL